MSAPSPGLRPVARASPENLHGACLPFDARRVARAVKPRSRPRSLPAQRRGDALADIIELIEDARRRAARAVNAAMTASYWLIGRRIVQEEQRGARRAEYGEALIEKLARRLTARFGRGFGRANLWQMRAFYLAYANILQTASGESSSTSNILQTASGESQLGSLFSKLPLPWSHYVKLLGLKHEPARQFYEQEALRGGWTVRQLERQINTQFYERTLLSRNKRAMLAKGEARRPDDVLTPEDEIKDPFVLEFLGLKDEYSENDLEEALVRDLEVFLLELGGDFAFVGRQRRLRIGDRWFRIDLLFFHRRLRCLVVIDLKLGAFDHADAGQMHLYLNYAAEHWMAPGENPPVGVILCAAKDEAYVKYALANHSSKVLAAEYRMKLPDEKLLVEHVERVRDELARRTGKMLPVAAELPRQRRPRRRRRR
jgi:predicted nuclease of restriction endonuclease-like (RecB) superfamily